ncbi:MAG: hypothetical protein ACI32P_03555, partial [Catenibacterium mitsuokai]
TSYTWQSEPHGLARGSSQNALGESMRVTFIHADSYCPGTYIKLKTKKKIVINQRIISESKVPQRALNQIKSYGRK